MTTPILTTFDENSPYRRLAQQLDALPNGYPPAPDESDLRLLAKIFTPEEADLAAQLREEKETLAEIAARLGLDMRAAAGQLKEMTRKGLIAMGKTAEGRLGFGLLPFVVGIYEAQVERLDAEMARLFEDYFQVAYAGGLKVQPQVHRVVPVRENIKNTMEVRPFESASELVLAAQSWGVHECICRKQKALIGQGCEHPRDNCMVLSDRPNAFDSGGHIRPLTQEEALQVLREAAEAGLVHSVSNNQLDTWYICNCCTCSCSILRGMAEKGIANVVARSAFVNQVDEDLCAGCGDCLEKCSFDALELDGVVQVSEMRCVGCGLCVPVCPQEALSLVRRADAPALPLDDAEWGLMRKSARGLN